MPPYLIRSLSSLEGREKIELSLKACGQPRSSHRASSDAAPSHVQVISRLHRSQTSDLQVLIVQAAKRLGQRNQHRPWE